MERLNPKLIPAAVSRAYSIFLQLARASGGEPLKFSEIKAWADLTGYELSTSELETIQKLDAAVINKRNELTKYYRDNSAQ